jgi:hypothetical protein
LSRNAQKRDKKKSNKTTEGEKKTEDGGEKSRFFRVFELPLLRNAQKTPLKKIDKNKNKNKNKVSNYFFFGAAANVRRFRHFFFTAPLV